MVSVAKNTKVSQTYLRRRRRPLPVRAPFSRYRILRQRSRIYVMVRITA